MHTVAQTESFVRAAIEAGLTDDDVDRLVSYLAGNPTAGDPIQGSGGCRKLRFARAGQGKRGGVRTITFYSGENVPVFLLTVFAKGERSDLSKKEQQQLAVTAKKIVTEYQSRVAKLAQKGN